MLIREISQLDKARLTLLQGLCRQTVPPYGIRAVRAALTWCDAVLAAGSPLPPAGFVADLGCTVLAGDVELSPQVCAIDSAVWPAAQRRCYDDYVVAKLYADPAFAKAVTAISGYTDDEKPRALAYLTGALQNCIGFGGMILPRQAVRELLALDDDSLSSQLSQASGQPMEAVLPELYEELVNAARGATAVIMPEDVFELEHKVALAASAERLAMRQILSAAVRLQTAVPTQPRLRDDIPVVATSLKADNSYPTGGFSSISTRGSVESLLHSQLAYMEPNTEQENRPDMFDIKFLRDELLYYARDDNQFFRRRRQYFIVLPASLTAARVKVAGLPYRPLVMALGACMVVIRTLLEWLSAESIKFTIWFAADEPDWQVCGLRDEAQLLQALFRDQIHNKTLQIVCGPLQALAEAELAADAVALRQTIYLHNMPTAADESTTQFVVGGRAALVSGVGDAATGGDNADDTGTVLAEGGLDTWILSLRQWLLAWAQCCAPTKHRGL